MHRVWGLADLVVAVAVAIPAARIKNIAVETMMVVTSSPSSFIIVDVRPIRAIFNRVKITKYNKFARIRRNHHE